MKKNVLLILIILVCLLTIVGCSSKRVEEDNGPKITAEDVTIYVGINFDANKYVQVADNIDLEVIENDVDDQSPGEYSVTYKATDENGVSTTKTIKVIVDELNQERLNLELKNMLSKNNLLNYSLVNYTGNGYYVFSDDCSEHNLNDVQTIKMYNSFSIKSDFLSSMKLSEDHYVYKVYSFNFNFEFTDRNTDLDKRYSPSSSDESMQISDGNNVLIIQNSGSGGASNRKVHNFDSTSYKSQIGYSMDIKELNTLKEILLSSTIKVKLNTYDTESLSSKKIFKSFEFDLNEDDISSLKEIVNLYDGIIDIIGEH